MDEVDSRNARRMLKGYGPISEEKVGKLAARQGGLDSRASRNSRFRVLSICGRRLRDRLLYVLFLFARAGQFVAAETCAAQTYRSGDWTTECKGSETAPECSVIVPLSSTEKGQRGTYFLAVLLSAGDIAILGDPPPIRAILRIGNNPAMECRESQPCLFPRDRSIDAFLQLASAQVVLVDVLTAKATFKFSLTTQGYRAGLRQMSAWGYFTH
jgi:hypothetical protein